MPSLRTWCLSALSGQISKRASVNAPPRSSRSGCLCKPAAALTLVSEARRHAGPKKTRGYGRRSLNPMESATQTRLLLGCPTGLRQPSPMQDVGNQARGKIIRACRTALLCIESMSCVAVPSLQAMAGTEDHIIDRKITRTAITVALTLNPTPSASTLSGCRNKECRQILHKLLPVGLPSKATSNPFKSWGRTAEKLNQRVRLGRYL